jgi:hypothetical protein
LTEAGVSLFKTTKLSEQSGLQFRAKFFNLLNNVNFGPPGIVMFTATGPSPTAATITKTATTPRRFSSV